MCKRRVRKQITLIVPFQAKDRIRQRVWAWLRQYWKWHLPDAEVIVGRDPKSKKRWWRKHPETFSKTAAMNRAFRKSHGDIIVIIDADVYLPAEVITHCAERIRAARDAGVHLWFMPYLFLYRLNEEATEEVLASDPHFPLGFPTPPDPADVEDPSGASYGHQWGALCQIMPREAFELVRGGDERFRGWGGEDSSLMRALDTLWGKHKNTTNQILHLWHPKFVVGAGPHHHIRVWDGQKNSRANDKLYGRYLRASGNPERMRVIVDEIPKQNWLTRRRRIG